MTSQIFYILFPARFDDSFSNINRQNSEQHEPCYCSEKQRETLTIKNKNVSQMNAENIRNSEAYKVPIVTNNV